MTYRATITAEADSRAELLADAAELRGRVISVEISLVGPPDSPDEPGEREEPPTEDREAVLDLTGEIPKLDKLDGRTAPNPRRVAGGKRAAAARKRAARKGRTAARGSRAR